MNKYDLPPLPKHVKISPSLICNLRCPLCPCGLGGITYPTKLMSLETFSIIINKLPSSIKNVSLYNMGEPFLNPDLLLMIKKLKAKSYKIEVHSNFSFYRKDDFFEELIASGLDILTLSIDGASQATYSQYRQGGNFDLVMGNLRKIQKYNQEKINSTLKIVWKYLVNRYNESELEKAKDIADSLGIQFVTDVMGLGDDLVDYRLTTSLEARKQTWLPAGKMYIKDCYKDKKTSYLFDCPCPELFSNSTIKPDGKIVGCCWVAKQENVFGDLITSSFEDIWYNNLYRYSRNLFKEGSDSQPCHTVCERCNNFKKILVKNK